MQEIVAGDRVAQRKLPDVVHERGVLQFEQFRFAHPQFPADDNGQVADPAGMPVLDVPADLITPCLDELAAADGVIREQVPAAARPAQAQAAPQVPAVYLPPCGVP